MLRYYSSLSTPNTLLSSTTSDPRSTQESDKGSSTSAVASLPRKKMEELVKQGSISPTESHQSLDSPASARAYM